MELYRKASSSLLGKPNLWQGIQHTAYHTCPPEPYPELKRKASTEEDRLQPFEGGVGGLEALIQGGIFSTVIAEDSSEVVKLVHNG